MPASSPCLIVLESDADDAALASAFEQVEGAKEVLAILPGHLDAPEGLPALVMSGVSDDFAAQMRAATEAALRPKRVIAPDA